MSQDWDEFDEQFEEMPEGIQDLLDEGYDLLDGFVLWLEEILQLDTRTAQQDCFNAEMLVDYVVEQGQKPITALDEFDLRWFFFQHYIRRTRGEPETERRLPDSLRRFFEYLRSQHAYEVRDWCYEILDMKTLYLERWRDFHALNDADEIDWLAGYRAWCADIENDLDNRCLWLPNEIGDELTWGESMGWREGFLRTEAHKRWMLNRHELIEQGYGVEDMRDRLADNYTLWLSTPQNRLDGMTPIEMILDERQQRAEETQEELDEQQ
ncbi:MAG: hypothetical protein NT023_17610 [Armatimonadetes bacterium]|nr:hypothetical protein [Armatimonadota bacterium]